jgi:uncharacterized protein YegP (UPF0339 family)
LKTSKFEVFKDKKGEFRFHLKAPNGEIILASQGYSQKHNCLNGIESIKLNATEAEVIDMTKKEAAAIEVGEPQVTALREESSGEIVEVKSKSTLTALISGIIGAVIGYFIAVSVSDLLGIILAVITGAVIGFSIVWFKD